MQKETLLEVMKHVKENQDIKFIEFYLTNEMKIRVNSEDFNNIDVNNFITINCSSKIYYIEKDSIDCIKAVLPKETHYAKVHCE